MEGMRNGDVTTEKMNIIDLPNVIKEFKYLVGNEGILDYIELEGAQSAAAPGEDRSENPAPDSRVEAVEDDRGSNDVTGGYKNATRGDVTETKGTSQERL